MTVPGCTFMWTFDDYLPMLAADDPRQRFEDARAFLHGTPSATAQARVDDARRFLKGDTRQRGDQDQRVREQAAFLYGEAEASRRFGGDA
jgi:hypothetical protein